MTTSLRVLFDIGLRSAALFVLSEVVAAATPSDDGLGTGLMVMLVLVCAAAGWGLWDGFHLDPVRLCVTWVCTGVAVFLVSTTYSNLRFGESSWSLLLNDLVEGLPFWSGLVFVPAIMCGIVQSATRPGGERRTGDVPLLK